jgi:hypothetical protein
MLATVKTKSNYVFTTSIKDGYRHVHKKLYPETLLADEHFRRGLKWKLIFS